MQEEYYPYVLFVVTGGLKSVSTKDKTAVAGKRPYSLLLDWYSAEIIDG